MVVVLLGARLAVLKQLGCGCGLNTGLVALVKQKVMCQHREDYVKVVVDGVPPVA